MHIYLYKAAASEVKGWGWKDGISNITVFYNYSLIIS